MPSATPGKPTLKSRAASRYLFVYGTLRSPFDNPYALRLRRDATLVGIARVPGRLYRLGGYPGLLTPGMLGPNPAQNSAAVSDDRVTGELYRLPDGADGDRLLSELDEYEGSEFERTFVVAERSGGLVKSSVKTSSRKSWVYVYRGPVSEAQRIVSGDYCE